MMKLQHLLLGAAIALMGVTSATAEPIGRPDYPQLLNKVDQFAYVVDQSGSMMMTLPGIKTQKIVLAKEVVAQLNSRIPTLPYTSSLYTVCPAGQVSAPAAWDRAALSNSVLGLPVDRPVFGRLTDLGGDMVGLAGQFPTNRGAVVLLTDGADNLHCKVKPADAARQLASAGTLLHIVSFAETAEGRANVAAMAAANPNTVVVNGMDLLQSPLNLDAFVKAVFYEDGSSTVIDSVYFATGKYDLDAAARATLDNLAAIITNVPRGVRTVEIEGFTDSVGGWGPMNSALSYNRAFASRDYLVSKGVPVEKVYTKGNNVSHKFTNNTNDGRQHNRRADLIIN